MSGVRKRQGMNGKKAVARIGSAIGGAIAAVLLLVLFGAFLIQRNTFPHRYLLAKMVQIGKKSAGTAIAIGDYSIRWFPLQVTLRDVIVRGREDALTTPLASLPRVEIGVSWRSLLHKKIEITQLILDRPAVYLAMDQFGKSNLPTRPAFQQPSSSKFQISIEHAAVRAGDLRYADLARKIDVNLPDLRLDANHQAADRYSGSFEYSRGEITADGYSPLLQSGEVNFTATDSGINFESVHVATDALQLNATGSMRGYSSPAVLADYRLMLSASELHKELPAVPLSGGEIELAGSLSYQAAAGALLQALKTTGRVSTPALRASLPNVKWNGKRPSNRELSLRSLTANYSLEGGNLQVRALRTEAMGGVVHAEFSAERLAAVPAYQLSVSAEGLSLEQIERIAPTGTAPLRGTANLQASAQWTSTVRNAIARADAAISASIDSVQSASNPAGQVTPQSLPLNADLHVAYDAPHSTLTVTNSSVASDGTTITATGKVNAHSSLSVHARSTDLRETDLLIASMSRILNAAGQASSSGSTPLDLRGAASIDARVEGQLQDPRISGHLEADALEIRQAIWPHIQADFDVSASSVTLRNGLAETANHGRLNFTLATSLQNWSYSAGNSIAAQLQASLIPAADLEQLTGISAPVSGSLSGDMSIQGPIDNPTGQASLELRDASLWGEPVRSVVTQVRAANKTISAQFTVAASAGTIGGEGQFDVPGRSYQISIGHSVLNLGQVHYFSSRGGIEGTLGIEAHGQGTLKAPQLDLTLDGERLAFRNTPVGSMSAQLHIADRQAKFDLTSAIAGGQIHATGNAGLASPYIVHGNFELHSPEFGPLLATYMRSAPADLRGTADVSGEIDGPLADPQKVKADVELSTLDLAYQNLTLASAGPVRLNYADSVLTISQAELKGTGTDFKFGGTLPLAGSAPLNITSTGSIDLHLLDVLGAHTQASGTVQIDVTAQGALKQPQIGGTIEMTNAAFISDVAPVGLDNVNARIALKNNRLTIENLSGQMGGGTFSVSGFASYAPVSFSLQVAGKSVRIRYPQGTRAQLDADLAFAGTPASSLLNGRVTIDQLSFTPDFDLANFVAQFNSSGVSVPSPWEQKTRLNVAVASSDVLALSSSQLSLQGSADLRVAGTLAAPVVLGRSTLTGGSLIFMHNVYQIQSGTIVFANPVRTEPTLNLYVNTTVESYDITLNFLGPLDRLRTNYTSDPALPPVDIIHLLAFGTTTAEAAATATPASLGAASLIANQLAGQVGNRLQTLTGISQLQLDPSLGGNNSDPGARVAIQERVASNILFTFATDLTNTQNEVVQVKYQTKGRLSFTLTRDEYGSYALEIKTRKAF
jgi:translocation and assembly module TamB